MLLRASAHCVPLSAVAVRYLVGRSAPSVSSGQSLTRRSQDLIAWVTVSDAWGPRNRPAEGGAVTAPAADSGVRHRTGPGVLAC